MNKSQDDTQDWQGMVLRLQKENYELKEALLDAAETLAECGDNNCRGGWTMHHNKKAAKIRKQIDAISTDR